jgi:hypothetical protein
MNLIKLLKELKKYYRYSPHKYYLSEYFSLLYMKDIKKFKVERTIEKKKDDDKLKQRDLSYMLARRKLDNKNTKDINKVIIQKERDNDYLNIDFSNYINNSINNKQKKRSTNMVQVFNKLEGLLNKRGKMSKTRKYQIQNIVEEHSNYINSRKVSNNLLKPHYFFTVGYNEKIKPSQIRH